METLVGKLLDGLQGVLYQGFHFCSKQPKIGPAYIHTLGPEACITNLLGDVGFETLPRNPPSWVRKLGLHFLFLKDHTGILTALLRRSVLGCKRTLATAVGCPLCLGKRRPLSVAFWHAPNHHPGRIPGRFCLYTDHELVV